MSNANATTANDNNIRWIITLLTHLSKQPYIELYDLGELVCATNATYNNKSTLASLHTINNELLLTILRKFLNNTIERSRAISKKVLYCVMSVMSVHINDLELYPCYDSNASQYEIVSRFDILCELLSIIKYKYYIYSKFFEFINIVINKKKASDNFKSICKNEVEFNKWSKFIFEVLEHLHTIKHKLNDFEKEFTFLTTEFLTTCNILCCKININTDNQECLTLNTMLEEYINKHKCIQVKFDELTETTNNYCKSLLNCDEDVEDDEDYGICPA